ncbi:SH3 domain protein [Nitrosomonas cryotolerans]|uniref:SH3 domain protein n=1 Tax=Nitrosomonas cryotolerans ATCC 49181 TaxID=1131553 RepID=A0A1N6J610_9PROT|nr:TIGR04211 family SH3 domain-containing protein [Nitrosomonas cryotolerans]SFP45617.1 SH3 domain protein [Nitrosomonas cryotolerans]SIO39764.1 SH3 domain protein [Nitrosomonas cryotolerans ATCC 49181]
MKSSISVPLRIGLIGLLLCLSLVVEAETRYVSDQFEITLRSGPSGKHAIQRMIQSGAALEIVEQDPEKGYTRVKTSGGTEGWVLSRYLMTRPAARDQLEKLRNQLTNSAAKGSSMRAQLITVKNDYDSATTRIIDLERENKRLESELAEIKQTAANVLEIEMRNKKLGKQLIAAKTHIDTLQRENSEFSSRQERDWFVAGALVLFVGLLLGLILPRIRWQKRSRYGGF